MYAVIRSFQAQGGSLEEHSRRVKATFVPQIRQAPGFVDYYFIITGPNSYSTISVFEEKDQALASTKLATDWLAKEGSPLVVGPPTIVSGEVTIAEYMAEAKLPTPLAEHQPPIPQLH